MISLAEVALRWVYLTIGFALLIFLGFFFIDEPAFEKFTWIYFIFSSFLSIAIIAMLRVIKTKYKELSTTVIVFFLITLRLFLSFFFLLLFILLDTSTEPLFVVPFIIIYSAYKIFEVVNLSRYANHIDKRIEQKII